jgi:diguanylate cyclase (GGDEF)-like protein
VITLKQFLSTGPEADHTPMHVVRLLVQGIGQHAAAGDGEESTSFREKMKEASETVIDTINPADLLVRAGWVLNELEQHTRRAERVHRLQNTELQNMVKMMASALSNISATSKVNISKLNDIAKNVGVASELNDVRLIKSKLSECLIDIQEEAKRQQTEIAETIQELREGLDRGREEPAHAGHGKTLDNVTGLPCRPDAESAIAEAARSTSISFVAVMVLERLQVLNARFGREAGDEILASYAQMVKKSLTSQDQLFRWGGPALVAVLARQRSLPLVRSEFTHIMETRLEHNIQTASRSVLIPVSAKWCLYPMMAAPRLLIQKIDEFAAGPTLRE